MKNFAKKFSFLAVMALLVFSFLPSITSAHSLLKTDLDVKLLGEANVLNIVKAGGSCDKIYVKVRVKELEGIVDVHTLKLGLHYDVYYTLKGDPLKGKLVANGLVKADQKGDYYEVDYIPAANPNGPAGIYAVKLYLGLGHANLVIAKVKINEPCHGHGQNNGGQDNNGGTNAGNNGGTNAGNNGGTNAGNNGGTNAGNNGGTNAGTNAGNNGGTNAGNNGGTMNAGNNGGTSNAGTNAGTNAGSTNAGSTKGGKLPKTANDFASSMAVGVALSLAGVGALAIRRRQDA